MPDQSSDPEQYTVDDMIARLRERDPSGKPPELVTRPDGSQVMRVRKRKRRTKQAASDETKRNHRLQVLQVGVVVVLVALLGLAAGIGILHANSSSFRRSLLGKLEDSSGAQASLNQFRMNPATANANLAAFRWPDGNPLAGLELQGITAKISPASFLGKAFSGEEVVAGKGILTLRAPDGSQPTRHRPRPAGGLAVEFDRYSAPEMDIRFGDDGGARRLLKATEASFFPIPAAGEAEIRLQGGLLEFDAWPAAELDRSYIKVKGGLVRITSMRFTVPKAANARKAERGYIDFSGSLRPGEAGAVHTLRAEASELSLPYLLGPDLGRFFQGNVDNREIPDSNFLTFSPASPESAMLELALSNSADSRIELAGFRFLSRLSEFLGDGWYESPNFEDDATFVVKRQSAGVSLLDINLVNHRRMAVRGSVSQGDKGGIAGNLRIGIPEAIIAASGNKRLDGMFGQVREGFRWLDLEIGGTSAIPADDFDDQYGKSSDAPDTGGTPGGGRQDRFEELIGGGE